MDFFKSKSSLDGPLDEKPNKKDVGPIENLIRNIIREDAAEAGSRVIEHHIIPAVRDMVLNAMHATVDEVFKQGNGIYNYGSSSISGVYTNYSKGSKNATSSNNNRIGTNGNYANGDLSSDRRSFDSRDYTFTRGEAEYIKDEIERKILHLGKADLATFLRHTNTTPTYIDQDLGWTDITNSFIRDVNTPNGKMAILFLPPPISIKGV